MLLTELILSKRGPLAKVWLSAHHERKLSKQQALGVDVEESVEAILTQDDGPTTLRLSGQLMLGVTRIYSRKVQYLLDDCKETRERITLAFRPGIVDLPEDQIKASKSAITFSDVRNNFDFLDWTWAALPPESTTRDTTTAPRAQISLRPTNREFGAYNFGRPPARSFDLSSRHGSASSHHGSHDHDSSSHLDSEDFSGIDLGISEALEGDESIEIGRRQTPASRAESVISRFGIREGSAMEKSGEIEVEEFAPIDLDLDFDVPDVPEFDQERHRRETSALSTPPPVSPPAEVSMTEITPRTAARVATLADAHDKALDVATQRVGAPKPKKARLLTADDELELADEDFAAPNDDESDLLGEERYIPSNPDIVRLQKIVGDPASHFLPTIKVGSTTMFYAGPQGLAPELAELFNFPATILRRERGEEQEQRQAKRPRLEAPQEEDVEVGRRQSVIPSEPRFHIGEFGGDETFGGSGDDHGLDFTAPEVGVPTFLTPRGKRAGQQEEREPSLAPSRAESIARQVQFGGDVDHPLAMFDTRASRTETGESLAQIQSQSLGTPSKSIISEERVTRGGYSKNTGMALGLLRRELEAIEEEDKVLRFERVANKASRRAASTFFFELLVLGTRDCVKLEQKKPFGDIEVRAKDKLFEEISA